MARGRFNFYLNFEKDDELLVAERIDDLKRRRSFTSVVREGIIIISELREGRLDTLLYRYPWIKDAVAAMLPPPPAPPTPQTFDVDELWRRFETYMEQGRGANIPDSRDSGFPAFAPVMKPSKLAAVKLSLPVFDDDADTLAPTRKAGAANGSGLLAGMLGLGD